MTTSDPAVTIAEVRAALDRLEATAKAAQANPGATSYSNDAAFEFALTCSPAFVLAQVAKDRAVLDGIEESLATHEESSRIHATCLRCSGVRTPCRARTQALAMLAAVAAAHGVTDHG